MEYLKKVEPSQLSLGSINWAFGKNTGTEQCSVAVVKTAPGKGSHKGRHSHPYEQIFYVVSGTMNVEIDNARYTAESGTLIYFPANVPHRNWNDGVEPTVHLSFMPASVNE